MVRGEAPNRRPWVDDFTAPTTKAPYRATIERTVKDDPARTAAIKQALKRIREKRKYAN